LKEIQNILNANLNYQELIELEKKKLSMKSSFETKCYELKKELQKNKNPEKFLEIEKEIDFFLETLRSVDSWDLAQAEAFLNQKDKEIQLILSKKETKPIQSNAKPEDSVKLEINEIKTNCELILSEMKNLQNFKIHFCELEFKISKALNHINSNLSISDLEYVQKLMNDWKIMKSRLIPLKDEKTLQKIMLEINCWKDQYKIIDSEFVKTIKTLCYSLKIKQINKIDFCNKVYNYFKANILKLDKIKSNDANYAILNVNLSGLLNDLLLD